MFARLAVRHGSTRPPTNKISRKLRLLPADGVIQEIPKTHRYKLTPKGQLLTTALFAVREATVSRLIGAAA